MQHDIIDNRDRKLVDCIKPLLSESERAKFAVGCLNVWVNNVTAGPLTGANAN